MEEDLKPSTDHFGHGDEIRQGIKKRLPKAPKRVLDVGTGFGRNLLFLKSILPESSIWSIDPSEKTLQNAEEMLKEKGLFKGVKLVQASAEKIPSEDGFFDLVTSVMVLHHVEDVASTCAEMYRVLAKGGKLLIVDWKPQAHTLPWPHHHRREDFVNPLKCKKVFKEIGVNLQIFQWPLWYILQAEKFTT